MGLSFPDSKMTLMFLVVMSVMAALSNATATRTKGSTYRLWYSTPEKHPDVNLAATTKTIFIDAVGLHGGFDDGGSTLDDSEHYCFGSNSWCIRNYATSDESVSLQVSLRRDEHDSVLAVDTELSTLSDKLSRNVLVDMVPKLNIQFDVKEGGKNHLFAWTIQREPTVGGEIPPLPSSLETVILSNRFLLDKKRLAAHEKMEIWQYVENENLVKAVFYNNYLHSISTPAGHAHAEAMVHPAMISHPNPQRVAILSVIPPIPIATEVLKHKSVKEVFLVGTANIEMFDLVRTHFMVKGWRGTSCLEEEATKMMIQSVESWLHYRVNLLEEGFDEDQEDDEYFDVIFLDVPHGKEEEWLSQEFQSLVKRLLAEDGIVVINAGSAPSFQTSNDENKEMSAREKFLFQATKKLKYGGLEYDALLVYDEDMAKPLDSTFLAAFPDSEEETYRRFVRKSSPAIDVDIVARFHPSNHQIPTVVYDGPTHAKYLTNSRAWETWYCNSLPSKDYYACKEFLVNWYDSTYHHSNTEVRKHPTKGRSLHTLEAIPRNHFVLPHEGAQNLRLDATQLEALEKFVQDFPDAAMYQQWPLFLNAYGYEISQLGGAGWTVAIASNATFTNHACTEHEQTVEGVNDLDEDGEWNGFSPVMTRRTELTSSLAVAKRHVQAGEEIATDYTSFRAGDDPDYFDSLRSMCQGGPGGLVPLDDEKESNDGNSATDEL